MRWHARIGAGWAIVVLLAAAVLRWTGRGGFTAYTHLVLQAAMFGLLFLLIAGRPALRAIFGALPASARMMMWAALFMCVLAQLVQTLQASYPLMMWHMYGVTARARDLQTYVYESETRAGIRSKFIPSRAFPAIKDYLLDWRLTRLLAKSPESAEAERSLRFLAQRYNRHTAREPNETIAVYLNDYTFDPVQKKFVETRELVRVIPVN